MSRPSARLPRRSAHSIERADSTPLHQRTAGNIQGRRSVLAAIPALLLLGGKGHAEAFPSRPISMFVPYSAGGQADSVARVYASPISTKLGQPVIIENLPGASGAIAAQKLLSAAPDGYRLFLGSRNEVIGVGSSYWVALTNQFLVP